MDARRPVLKAAARLLLLALVCASAACARRASLLEPGNAQYVAVAPDSFDVELVTTKGTMMVRIIRSLSPHGVDRFHALVRTRFFDGVAFHRTIRNFVAQFGIHGDTAVTAAWNGKTVPDDTVRLSNTRGTLSFARSGPNTRSTQLYFNLVDNPRLDTLNIIGFPPIGGVVQGMTVLDSLNWEYSGTRGGETFPGPAQDSIRAQGNAYLQRVFPRLDYILTARIKRSWR
jgi:cyclophilin family peptidyl-prolyl cis-trans isomerase